MCETAEPVWRAPHGSPLMHAGWLWPQGCMWRRLQPVGMANLYLLRDTACAGSLT